MKRLVILGGGESGVGAAILGKDKGFDVFLSDSGELSAAYAEVLRSEGIAYEEGGHSESLILNADEVVKSPGIAPTVPLVQKLIAQGTPIISEIELAGRYTKSKMVCTISYKAIVRFSVNASVNKTSPKTFFANTVLPAPIKVIFISQPPFLKNIS